MQVRTEIVIWLNVKGEVKQLLEVVQINQCVGTIGQLPYCHNILIDSEDC